MKRFDGAQFSKKFDNGGASYSEAVHVNCAFDNCGLSLSKRPGKMSVVSRVDVFCCSAANSEIGPCVFEDVLVRDLRTNPILLVCSSFFRRVRLAGKIGKLNINLAPWGFCTDPDVLSSFATARSEFYAGTDWALDISEARFLAFRCAGVPLDLVRRDPETQVILRKGVFPGMQAIDQRFKNAFPETYDSLKIFCDSGDEEALRVVPLAAPKSRKDDWKGGIAELRTLGFLRE